MTMTPAQYDLLIALGQIVHRLAPPDDQRTIERLGQAVEFDAQAATPPEAAPPAPKRCAMCGDAGHIPVTSPTASGAWIDCPECCPAAEVKPLDPAIQSSAHRFGTDPRPDLALEASGTGFEVHSRDVGRMRAKQQAGRIKDRPSGAVAWHGSPLHLEFAHVSGHSLEQWRESFRKTELFHRGDARLIWANEGDLINLQMAGVAVEVIGVRT